MLCHAWPPTTQRTRMRVSPPPPPPPTHLQVLQEMLDMLRDHLNNFHTARLEWIVIWLIVVEVVVGLFECASILGWVGTE